MSEKIYVNAIRTFKPRAGAPNFVLGDMVINIDEFAKFVKENEKYITKYNGQRQMRVQILESKYENSPFNLRLDTYSAEKSGSSESKPAAQKDPADDLPF